MGIQLHTTFILIYTSSIAKDDTVDSNSLNKGKTLNLGFCNIIHSSILHLLLFHSNQTRIPKMLATSTKVSEVQQSKILSCFILENGRMTKTQVIFFSEVYIIHHSVKLIFSF